MTHRKTPADIRREALIQVGLRAPNTRVQFGADCFSLMQGSQNLSLSQNGKQHALIHTFDIRNKRGELENAVRDYIAKHPWLLSPHWETFQKERGIQNLVDDALGEAGISKDVDWNGRVDLVMRSGGELLLVEFMRPGLTLDYDHIDRFARYVRIMREKIGAQTALGINRVTGLLVAEKLNRKPGTQSQIKALEREQMGCLEWEQLLERAKGQWREFLQALGSRTPRDDRLAQLQENAGIDPD